MTDIFQKPDKLSCKKKRQINKNMEKTGTEKTSSKATISNLDIFDKNALSVFITLIKISKPKAQNIDIAMIDVDTYFLAFSLK